MQLAFRRQTASSGAYCVWCLSSHILCWQVLEGWSAHSCLNSYSTLLQQITNYRFSQMHPPQHLLALLNLDWQPPTCELGQLGSDSRDLWADYGNKFQSYRETVAMLLATSTLMGAFWGAFWAQMEQQSVSTNSFSSSAYLTRHSLSHISTIELLLNPSLADSAQRVAESSSSSAWI